MESGTENIFSERKIYSYYFEFIIPVLEKKDYSHNIYFCRRRSPQHSKDSAIQKCLSPGATVFFLYIPLESQPQTFARLQTSTFPVFFGGFSQVGGDDIKPS